MPAMNPTPDALNDIVRAIQLALAPAFLLTAIAGLLNVMAGRLARIIDRGRALTEGRVTITDAMRDAIHKEQVSLEQRRHLTSVAITAGTIAALLVCLVIAVLFIEAIFGTTLRWLIGAMFTAAMLALVIGLGYFLREVHLAMQVIRIPVPKKREQGGAGT